MWYRAESPGQYQCWLTRAGTVTIWCGGGGLDSPGHWGHHLLSGGGLLQEEVGGAEERSC